MFKKIKSRTAALAATAVVALTTAGGFGISGCGDGDASSQQPNAATQTDASHANNPIPESILTAESGAEDTIDFALAGEVAKAVDSANALDEVAQGQAADDLSAVGVSAAKIAEFQARSAEVARLAPNARPLDTALASNRAFELVAGFFGQYQELVPAEVITLDYLDFEASLQALAGNRPAARTAVAELAATWDALRPEVVAAGGAQPAASFDQHVDAMQQLVSGGADQQLADEAQNGLDLVDEIEGVYAG